MIKRILRALRGNRKPLEEQKPAPERPTYNVHDIYSADNVSRRTSKRGLEYATKALNEPARITVFVPYFLDEKGNVVFDLGVDGVFTFYDDARIAFAKSTISRLQGDRKLRVAWVTLTVEVRCDVEELQNGKPSPELEAHRNRYLHSDDVYDWRKRRYFDELSKQILAGQPATYISDSTNAPPGWKPLPPTQYPPSSLGSLDYTGVWGPSSSCGGSK